MYMAQNLKAFIKNPAGPGSTAQGNIQIIRDDLNRRFLKLVKEKPITLDVYRDKDEYYFHFKIPSETERTNTYDVVLHFTMGEDDFKYDNFINNYYMIFFSNSPNFVYTFAYTYNEYGLLIPHLANKYKDIVLDQNPLVRNPGEVVNYDKSIYFACHYIEENRKYLNKMHLNSIAKPFDVKKFNELIRPTDRIDIDIKKEDKRLRDEKRKIKEDALKKPKKVIERVSDTVKRIVPLKKIVARKSSKPKIKSK